MFVISNRIAVTPGREQEFEERFRKRLRAVERAPGFVRLALLRPVAVGGRYVVQVWWESQEAFEAWRDSPEFRAAHADPPPPELFAAPNEMEIHEVVEVAEAAR